MGEVEIENIAGKEYNEGFVIWHSNKKYKYNHHYIQVTDSVGGCGMQQLYKWSNCVGIKDEYEISSILLNAILGDLHSGVGLIICQLGQDYYECEFERALIDKGFESVVEYENHQHEDGYMQKVYQLIIRK